MKVRPEINLQSQVNQTSPIFYSSVEKNTEWKGKVNLAFKKKFLSKNFLSTGNEWMKDSLGQF